MAVSTSASGSPPVVPKELYRDLVPPGNYPPPRFPTWSPPQTDLFPYKYAAEADLYQLETKKKPTSYDMQKTKPNGWMLEPHHRTWAKSPRGSFDPRKPYAGNIHTRWIRDHRWAAVVGTGAAIYLLAQIRANYRPYVGILGVESVYDPADDDFENDDEERPPMIPQQTINSTWGRNVFVNYKKWWPF
eukprot:gnl/Spiro4/4514_TR2243_c0_g1_i1.p1 gnl/Spiro4/4514_TR2243_c0_g1~~gnl/Spiro4/4514_TR2243_c0_g1_i1.p1  ORF type:complete len:202 (-),score=39.03 gnl/Spiro4/4514_TR2243_c0_g1_i1:64-627(-)